MKYIPIFLISILFSHSLWADVMDNVNSSYQRITAKHRAKNDTRGCHLYVDVFGNKDWAKKKKQLNTLIANTNKCRKITIYKVIRNVKIRNGSNVADKEFDINLGTIINGNAHLNIETITILENVTITDGYFNSKANVGNVVRTGKAHGGVRLNNVRMKSQVIIRDSKVGSDWVKEMVIEGLDEKF